MSTIVNMNIAEGLPDASNAWSGTLYVTITHKGWPAPRITAEELLMPVTSVITVTKGVLSEDVVMRHLDPHDHYYSMQFIGEGVSYTVDARLPNNYDDPSIDFADLHFKGAL